MHLPGKRGQTNRRAFVPEKMEQSSNPLINLQNIEADLLPRHAHNKIEASHRTVTQYAP